MAGLQAVVSSIGLVSELYSTAKDETLSDDERLKRQAGATGDAFGSIAGSAAGAFIGSLVLPGVGTVVGGMIGGWLGGTGGRWAGETLGSWKDKTQRELDTAQNNYQNALEEAANTIGKTEEEIENVRLKLTEAEVRLENAKQAGEAKKSEEEAKKRDHAKLMNAWARGYNQSGGLPAVTPGGNVWHNNHLPPGLISRRSVNDLIVTPQGQFSTHPADYIFAMKNPAALINPETPFPRELHNEIRSVERIPQAAPPIVVEGEIELRSELVIDDKGYRLRQSAGKNTTPYKFSVGSAKNARLIQ
jgi:hypothetical protein